MKNLKDTDCNRRIQCARIIANALYEGLCIFRKMKKVEEIIFNKLLLFNF